MGRSTFVGDVAIGMQMMDSSELDLDAVIAAASAAAVGSYTSVDPGTTCTENS